MSEMVQAIWLFYCLRFELKNPRQAETVQNELNGGAAPTGPDRAAKKRSPSRSRNSPRPPPTIAAPRQLSSGKPQSREQRSDGGIAGNPNDVERQGTPGTVRVRKAHPLRRFPQDVVTDAPRTAID